MCSSCSSWPVCRWQVGSRRRWALAPAAPLCRKALRRSPERRRSDRPRQRFGARRTIGTRDAGRQTLCDAICLLSSGPVCYRAAYVAAVSFCLCRGCECGPPELLAVWLCCAGQGAAGERAGGGACGAQDGRRRSRREHYAAPAPQHAASQRPRLLDLGLELVRLERAPNPMRHWPCSLAIET